MRRLPRRGVRTNGGSVGTRSPVLSGMIGMNFAVNLTRACTRSCEFCYLASGSQCVDVSRVRSAVAQLRPSSVTLTGGEPLLYESIDQLLTDLSLRGVHIHLLTNGDLLGAKRDILRLTKPDLFVSLNTLDLPVVARLSELHGIGMRIYLHVLLARGSLLALEDICQEVSYAAGVYLLYPTATPHNKVRMPLPSAWFPMLSKARHIIDRHGIPVRFEQAFSRSEAAPCPTGQDVFMDVDGRTYACCIMVNYHQGSCGLEPIPMKAQRCPFLREFPGTDGYRRICPITLTDKVDGPHLFPSDLP